MKHDKSYMKMAVIWSKNSYAKRKQVGCLIVKNKSIIADGYNGTPSGMPNVCEDEENKTHWYVLHAEANALSKVMKSDQSSEGATMYVTLAPCQNCSKLILQSGIKRLVYLEFYGDYSGIDFLKQNGILVEQIFLNNEKTDNIL